jgi:tetratricopeptide (TPR) repeat protein
MASKVTIPSVLIGATIGLVGTMALLYYTKSRNRKNSLQNEESVQIADDNNDKLIAEDVEEDDDQEEETEENKEKHGIEENKNSETSAEDEETEKKLKEKYEELTRIATKLSSGNAYLRAAEKFKEAIKLAEKLPSVSKDLVTLYNNSSAMYEKAGIYDEAMLDINIVLHMDTSHIKARLRRARIYETQVIINN